MRACVRFEENFVNMKQNMDFFQSTMGFHYNVESNSISVTIINKISNKTK